MLPFLENTCTDIRALVARVCLIWNVDLLQLDAFIRKYSLNS